MVQKKLTPEVEGLLMKTADFLLQDKGLRNVPSEVDLYRQRQVQVSQQLSALFLTVNQCRLIVGKIEKENWKPLSIEDRKLLLEKLDVLRNEMLDVFMTNAPFKEEQRK
jgi:hypothetical protein